MARRRLRGGDALNPWPGYVDALSTLLMVIIFVLLVFVLAQAFLSVALSGRDRAVDRLNRQVAELSDMLSLERGQSADLKRSVAQLGREAEGANSARDDLTRQLAATRLAAGKVSGERDSLRAERDTLSAKLADTALQAQSSVARTDALQAQLAEAARKADAVGRDAASIAGQLATARATLGETQRQLDETRKLAAAQLAASQLALAASQRQTEDALKSAATQLAASQASLDNTQRQLDDMRKLAASLDRTVMAGKATIEARLSDIARMSEQLRALSALRDQLERQAQEAAARATTEAERRAAVQVLLADQQKLGDSARAEMAALTARMDAVRGELARLNRALDAAQAADKDKDAQIVSLNTRLVNSALAQKVAELQNYRSEFFGKLRDVLANRPGITVVGDRFVFQSEVLFPAGGADMTQAGQDEIGKLATTLKEIIPQIPAGLNWVLRIDGHADKQATSGTRFPSNWELSSQRATNVVKLLIADGIPANRLASAGFGDNQPIDVGDTPDALAKNRRIEIRLTDR